MNEENGKEDKGELGELSISCELARFNDLELEFRETEEYKALEARRKELYSEIEEAVSSEADGDILKFADLYTDMMCNDSRFFYSHSFSDGAQFMSSIVGKEGVGGLHISVATVREGE